MECCLSFLLDRLCHSFAHYTGVVWFEYKLCEICYSNIIDGLVCCFKNNMHSIFFKNNLFTYKNTIHLI